jgi:hypothetical protein
VTLAGCPLDEKISEMHTLRAQATIARRVRHYRHRQSDDGGDRPSDLQRLHEGLHLSEAGAGRYSAGETRILKDVLALPWGFEIYSLLTRWNPLDIRRPLPRSGQRPQGADRRPRPGRGSPWRTI